MNALITGAGGMLAHALDRVLDARGWTVSGLSRSELDVTRRADVEAALNRFRPDVVFHCAAFTAVDAAEEESEAAFSVNRDGARIAAEGSAQAGALFVYPSTDYVFSGVADRPWRVDDPKRPASVYGRSKLEGEQAVREAGDRHLIARTSWLYGAGGKNFVDTMIRLGSSHDTLRVVADQVGRPTWTRDLALALVELAEANEVGTLHIANQGQTTWRDLAAAALRAVGSSTRVDSVTTAEYGAPAPRPLYSVLDLDETERRLGRPMPHWETSLRRYLQSQNDP